MPFEAVDRQKHINSRPLLTHLTIIIQDATEGQLQKFYFSN